jgi:hypothetical protein
MKNTRILKAPWLVPVAAMSLAAWADDGMWTYHQPPVDLLRSKYRFEATRDWLDKLRLASVSTGASASFVSPDGLYLTNAHVALDCAKNLSSAGEDLVGGGFLARSRSEERQCPGVEARQLVSYSNVTPEVKAAETAERNRRIAAVEKDCRDTTKLRCEVVTLYRGAEYWLYRYRTWTDVRLVFQPENDIAFFGGDTDNFVYPRYSLDAALLRAYEDGRPAKTPQFLRVAKRGVAEGDLVFSSGTPYSTDRLLSVSEILLHRDRLYPLRLSGASDEREALARYGDTSPEAARRVLSTLHGTENYVKVLKGETRALADESLLAKKRADESLLREKARAELEAGRFRWNAGDPWQRIDAAIASQRMRGVELHAVDYGYGTLTRTANDIVALAYEGQREDGARLKDYREAKAARLRRRIEGDTPWYKDLETVRLAQRIREAPAAIPLKPRRGGWWRQPTWTRSRSAASCCRVGRQPSTPRRIRCSPLCATFIRCGAAPGASTRTRSRAKRKRATTRSRASSTISAAGPNLPTRAPRCDSHSGPWRDTTATVCSRRGRPHSMASTSATPR